MKNKTLKVFGYSIKKLALGMAVYYLLITAATGVIICNFNAVDGMQAGNQFFTTLLFIFLIGCTLPYRLFAGMISNGFSRKNIFIAVLCSGTALSLICSAADRLVEYLFYGYTSVSPLYNIFFFWIKGETKFTSAVFLSGALFYFLLYLADFAFAFAMGLLYRKLSPAVRLAAAGGLVALSAALFFLIDVNTTNIINILSGVNSANPYIGMITFSAIILIFTTAAFFITKRTELKSAYRNL